MICTRCELWELTREDNFCSWCAAPQVIVKVVLEPAQVRATDYPPPVQLIIRNASPERTIELAGFTSDATWVSLLPVIPAVPAGLIKPGQQEIFLLDADTFSAGTASTAQVDVHLAHAGSASTELHLLRNETPFSVQHSRHLPYPTWRLTDGQQTVELPSSTSFQVVDTSSGKTWRLREYRAQTRPSQSLLSTFIIAAKSLRQTSLASMWVSFAYTVDGRCYTVGNDIPGRPLQQAVIPGKLDRTEIRSWLQAVLQALHDLHSQAGTRGQLYHGALELRHMLVPGTPGGELANQTSGAHVMLTSSMYLEHLLTESPYSPEYFIESDLRHAGLAILSLITGTDIAHIAQPALAAMLAAVDDVAVGATLDFLVAPAANQPSSAQQVLALYESLVRAETENHQAEFERAHALSGSARLLPVIATLGQVQAAVEQGRRRAAEHATRQRLLADQEATRRAAQHSTAAANAAMNPPFVPVPVPPPPRPGSSTSVAFAPWSDRLKRMSRFMLKSLKILTTTTLVLLTMGALILLALVGSWLRDSKPAKPAETQSLSLTATPNPVQRGQRTALSWASKGYDRVLLDGNPVGPTGFRMLYPSSTVTYHLQAFTPSGARKTTELRILVLGTRSKPKPGVENTPPSPSQPAGTPD